MLRILLSFSLLASILFASGIAIVKKVSGNTYIIRDKKEIKIKTGNQLEKGDIIITKKDGSIGVIFQDGTLLSLGENSIISIDKYTFKPAIKKFAFELNMKKGVATFESGKIGKLDPKAVHFKVPEGTIGIRGTKFYVEVK